MGIFKMFKKKDKEYEVERISIFDIDYPMDRSNWQHVFSACLGKVMAIQQACSKRVVKGQNWNVDFTEGVILFGKEKYPLQFIGSESKSSQTWLWGWENINQFPNQIIEVADHMKNMGDKWNLEVLKISEFTLDEIYNGHHISIVVCGLMDDYCYYRGPHDGGAILVAFSSLPKEVFEPVDMHRFSTITMDCIQQYQIDHKIFIESFLMWNGTKYEWNENTIIAHFEQEMSIEFEELEHNMRIASMKTH